MNQPNKTKENRFIVIIITRLISIVSKPIKVVVVVISMDAHLVLPDDSLPP